MVEWVRVRKGREATIPEVTCTSGRGSNWNIGENELQVMLGGAEFEPGQCVRGARVCGEGLDVSCPFWVNKDRESTYGRGGGGSWEPRGRSGEKLGVETVPEKACCPFVCFWRETRVDKKKNVKLERRKKVSNRWDLMFREAVDIVCSNGHSGSCGGKVDVNWEFIK